MKTASILGALALVACLLVLGSRPDEPISTSAARGPSFEVHVEKPLLGRPLLGLLPDETLGFDQVSHGAAIGRVASDRFELRADGGWDLALETDGQGRIAAATRLVFPLTLGGRRVRLSCRPADPAVGYLRTTPRAATGELDGRFLVELAHCRNADSGKVTAWPSSPLTVRGRFERLARAPGGAGSRSAPGAG
jgi:hypothetical protein